LLKPINTKELKASIEMGLYKIDMERRQQRIFEAVVHTITEMVKLHDPYLNDVQLRAAQLSVAIATELNLPGQEVSGIQIAAMLHGIGLVALPAYLLSNRTELQGAKKLYYQTHTEIAWNLLKNIEFPYPVAEMVYQHMERLDGSGYPRGLSDDAILPGARVVAVACQTAKMLTSHGIEPAASLDTTLSELESGSGTLYDPLAVEACCRLFREKHFAFKD
jgi:response regulator RpfG family c-di-GMP phosphodiesterase